MYRTEGWGNATDVDKSQYYILVLCDGRHNTWCMLILICFEQSTPYTVFPIRRCSAWSSVDTTYVDQGGSLDSMMLAPSNEL